MADIDATVTRCFAALLSMMDEDGIVAGSALADMLCSEKPAEDLREWVVSMVGDDPAVVTAVVHRLTQSFGRLGFIGDVLTDVDRL